MLSCTVLQCSVLYRNVTIIIAVSRCTGVTGIFHDLHIQLKEEDHLMPFQKFIIVESDYFCYGYLQLTPISTGPERLCITVVFKKVGISLGHKFR